VAGATNLYRFSSAPHSVYGGFFPLDPRPITSHLFSDRKHNRSRNGNDLDHRQQRAVALQPLALLVQLASFGAGAKCKADQYVFPPSFAPGIDPAVWFGQNPNGAWIPQAQGWFHDSWFSVEARYLFAFNGPFQLQFSAMTIRSCSSTACW